MEGDFYKLGVINCKKLTWNILIHAMKNIKPETRARLQFNLFEWLQHAINILENVEEKKLLKEMCEAISHSVQISLLNLKHPGWKKQIIKTTSLFLRKNEKNIIELVTLKYCCCFFVKCLQKKLILFLFVFCFFQNLTKFSYRWEGSPRKKYSKQTVLQDKKN